MGAAGVPSLPVHLSWTHGGSSFRGLQSCVAVCVTECEHAETPGHGCDRPMWPRRGFLCMFCCREGPERLPRTQAGPSAGAGMRPSEQGGA